MVNEENLNFLFSLNGADITRTQIYTLFNKKHLKKDDGSIEILDPMFFPYEPIKVKAGQLSNITKDIETTVGRYVYNMVIVDFAFGNAVPYVNETIKNKEMGNFTQMLCDLLIWGKITTHQFAAYQERLVWFNNFSEILMPGLSIDLLVLPEPIKDELQRLVDANRESILNNDTVSYINNVEKPILAFAKKYYKDTNDPGWGIYELGGKPKFDNVFKNMFLETGPIFDIATGKYRISTRCFSDGISPEEQALYANSAISGAFNRAVNTAYAGARTKEFASAFQSLVVTEDDCGSKGTVPVVVKKNNVESIKWVWIKAENGEIEGVDENGYVLVTPDIVKNYIGKTVHSRSPLFCRSDNLCWKCMGEVYKRIGTKNVGLTLMKLTSQFLNMFLKSMHDATISTMSFDPKDCFYKI